MTINEQQIAKMIESELGYTNGWAISNEDYTNHCLNVAKKILKKLQPKTTSTDIGGIRKEAQRELAIEVLMLSDVGNNTDIYNAVTKKLDDLDIDYHFPAKPHLSNKSELKKEAVREFVDFYESINGLEVTKGCSHVRKIAEEYLSSDEKEENNE